MEKLHLTTEQIETEIERLKKSPYVRLARDENRLRQQLYNLRSLEKQGKRIALENGLDLSKEK